MRRANAASGLGKGQTSNASRAWRPRLLGEPPENCARTQIRLPRLCFERSLRVSLAATTSLEHLSEESGPCILPRLDSELKPDSSPSTESQTSPCKLQILWRLWGLNWGLYHTRIITWEFLGMRKLS